MTDFWHKYRNEEIFFSSFCFCSSSRQICKLDVSYRRPDWSIFRKEFILDRTRLGPVRTRAVRVHPRPLEIVLSHSVATRSILGRPEHGKYKNSKKGRSTKILSVKMKISKWKLLMILLMLSLVLIGQNFQMNTVHVHQMLVLALILPKGKNSAPKMNSLVR